MSHSTFAPAPSTGLSEAVDFLILPLSLALPILALDSLKQILLSTLTSVPAWLRNSRLTLTFSSGAPPRPIYAACIATQVDWSQWFNALGGREFDLTIERTLVTIQITGTPERVVIWKQGPALRPTFLPAASMTEPEPKIQVPISKLSQSVQLNKVSDIAIDSLLAATQSKTLDQELLEFESGKEEEADEIFAMISNLDTCVISAIPARDCFTGLSTLQEEILHSQSSFRQTMSTGAHDVPSPISSPESSRPSSPSSTFSPYSSQESLTSVSAISSLPISHTDFVSTKSPIKSPKSLPIVDTTKNEVQRYLYQGGQSTVLTGGVMLGGPASKTKASPSPTSSTPSSCSSSVPKYRAPIHSRNAQSFSKAKPQQIRARFASGNWRRADTLSV